MDNNICPHAQTSLTWFLFTIMFASTATILKLGYIQYIYLIVSLPLLARITATCLVSLIGRLAKGGYINIARHSSGNHDHSFQQTLGVSIRSLILSVLFSVGLKLIFHIHSHFISLGLYLCVLSLFHFNEYFVTSIGNPTNLSTDIFLINQSPAYILATLSSIVEFLIEFYWDLPPSQGKQFNTVTFLGLSLCLVGEFMRKSAILTAGQGFTHIISTTRHPDHELITHGVYSLMRHPSYAGWFYWALGTQLILQNPICFGVFMLVAWNFFADRIPYEEEILLEFFGTDYLEYRKKVPTGIPFIKT